MKPRIQDLKINQSVEVNFTAPIEKIDNEYGVELITLKTPNGKRALIHISHLAEVLVPEEL